MAMQNAVISLLTRKESPEVAERVWRIERGPAESRTTPILQGSQTTISLQKFFLPSLPFCRFPGLLQMTEAKSRKEARTPDCNNEETSVTARCGVYQLALLFFFFGASTSSPCSLSSFSGRSGLVFFGFGFRAWFFKTFFCMISNRSVERQGLPRCFQNVAIDRTLCHEVAADSNRRCGDHHWVSMPSDSYAR